MSIFSVVDGPMSDMVSAYADKMAARREAKKSWCPECKTKVLNLRQHFKRRDHLGLRMAWALESRQNELWGWDE